MSNLRYILMAIQDFELLCKLHHFDKYIKKSKSLIQQLGTLRIQQSEKLISLKRCNFIIFLNNQEIVLDETILLQPLASESTIQRKSFLFFQIIEQQLLLIVQVGTFLSFIIAYY
ncbi:unnamed protein product (macronuclear) [Paramecium tetraurelia]|uniref:Transmembrane protein n=1 Tax=Paramecium tetraurelia TaxID=5888 RepID=A0D2Y1_PARTE|nr:uncharacterized protein GSPATT00012883001 [Paramecium tetraurelia]CAK77398.1 unnamed protein product [Paramecium tetraurelia]|eukprot:XP_001444795.1 hypothetical protein (macronuclear) [Paramecium tetraurelia strain d4-2]